jgi:hypothetical protein
VLGEVIRLADQTLIVVGPSATARAAVAGALVERPGDLLGKGRLVIDRGSVYPAPRPDAPPHHAIVCIHQTTARSSATVGSLSTKTTADWLQRFGVPPSPPRPGAGEDGTAITHALTVERTKLSQVADLTASPSTRSR